MTNPLDRPAANSNARELAVGETRMIGDRFLVRTARRYAFDLADAYNRNRPDDGKSWFVDHGGNLRFGDTPEGERHTAKQIVRRREAERDRWLRNYNAPGHHYSDAA